MSEKAQPDGPGKKARKQVGSNKKNARIGFLESLGDSGYDNRTDPNYCFDILQDFRKKEDPDEETLD